MAIQTVGIGAAPNDNTGDTPRTGIAKLNANFTDPTNAASRLVQTSPTDATAGRVMLTGAGGLLGNAPDELGSADNVKNSIKYATGTATNKPGGANGVIIDVSGGGSNNYGFQFGGRGFFASPQVRMQEAGVFTAWQQLYTGANLVKAQNVSGGTVLASGTTAGANLVPAQVGNWSPATDTVNNARNLWTKQ